MNFIKYLTSGNINIKYSVWSYRIEQQPVIYHQKTDCYFNNRANLLTAEPLLYVYTEYVNVHHA